MDCSVDILGGDFIEETDASGRFGEPLDSVELPGRDRYDLSLTLAADIDETLLSILMYIVVFDDWTTVLAGVGDVSAERPFRDVRLDQVCVCCRDIPSVKPAAQLPRLHNVVGHVRILFFTGNVRKCEYQVEPRYHYRREVFQRIIDST